MLHRVIRDPMFGLLALIAAAGILYLGQRPSGTIPRPRIPVPHADKIVHFTMYFGFAALAIRARRGRGNRSPLATEDVVAVLVAAAIVGAVDELWQYHADKGRSGEVMDWIADLAGAGGALVLTAIRSRPIVPPTTTTSSAASSPQTPG